MMHVKKQTAMIGLVWNGIVSMSVQIAMLLLEMKCASRHIVLSAAHIPNKRRRCFSLMERQSNYSCEKIHLDGLLAASLRKKCTGLTVNVFIQSASVRGIAHVRHSLCDSF